MRPGCVRRWGPFRGLNWGAPPLRLPRFLGLRKRGNPSEGAEWRGRGARLSAGGGACGGRGYLQSLPAAHLCLPGPGDSDCRSNSRRNLSATHGEDPAGSSLRPSVAVRFLPASVQWSPPLRPPVWWGLTEAWEPAASASRGKARPRAADPPSGPHQSLPTFALGG